MSDVDELREAAQLMRERAAACDGPTPWRVGAQTYDCGCCERVTLANGTGLLTVDDMYSAHIASWHPAVALAVADWIDAEVPFSARGRIKPEALAVARAYLGTQP